MSLGPLLAAAMVAAAVPIAFWSMSRPATAGADPATMLRGGRSLDLRDVELSRGATERLLGPLAARLARAGGRLTPRGEVERMERRLGAAGLAWTVERLLALKLLLLAVGGVVGLVWFAAVPGPLTLILAGVLAGAGWFGPDISLRERAARRRDAVRRALPDTIDQVTIAVEAGLGFEAALARVGANGSGPLAEELARALQDVQLGVPRAEALGGMATRTELPEMHRLVAAIRQSERYGVPIANILRVQAAELRERRRQRAEERAMKIPVKVVLPLILCILPTLFIVVLGPAAARFLS